jgi:hypothetical protein
VRQWLTCLASSDAPFLLVCEHVEDLTLVYGNRFRFLQLKTRDRGSWSASTMCDKGIDSLCRSYRAARDAGIHEIATFELWFEGPISERKETVSFAENPSSASENLRTKIVRHGLRKPWLDDFLGRLVIHPGQPTRVHIDAKALLEIHALWPALSHPELLALYERMLNAAEAAQSAEPPPYSVQAHLAKALPHVGRRLPCPGEPGEPAWEPIRNQVLDHATLADLTPPLSSESVEQLLARISKGQAASIVELKMQAAGAAAETIQRAKQLRAEMDVEQQQLLASRETAEADLEPVATRLLVMAEATAGRIAQSAVSNPAAAGRPAEAIANDLLSRPGDLAQCDKYSLFGRDGYLLYGYLVHLSDLCKFLWRKHEHV